MQAAGQPCPPFISKTMTDEEQRRNLEFLMMQQKGKKPGEALQMQRQQMQQAMGPATPAPNDFQLFVEKSIGRSLPMFGYDLFNLPPSTFAPIQGAAVPDDYIIGPGDQLNVRIWGPMDFSSTLEVDRNGNIFLPRVGQVVVAGLRYSQLSQRIKESLSRMFKNFEATASIAELRSIQVYVVGYAKQPGVYTVSSLSTLVNAIFSSGGPSTSGSMRNIELRRGGNVITKFDMYDLLTRGDISKDVKLQPGDVIFFPPIGSLVAIPNEVRSAAIYELRGESTLGQAIETAGGFSTTAYVHEATVESIQNRQMRAVERFALDEAGLKHPVKDGDLLIFAPVSSRFENAVTLRGNVARSGRYPFKEGMRIRDLLPTWQSLIAPEYWERLNSSSERISEFGIKNDVRYEMVDINWDYALIERLDTAKLTTQLLPFNLGKAVIDGDPNENLVLQPGDIVTIFSQRDFRVPIAKRSKFVSVEGEFKAAGVYKLLPEETLPHLLERIGGFTDDAYVEGTELLRDSVQMRQQKALNDFTARMEADVESAALNDNTSVSQDRNGTSAAQDARSRIQLQRQMLAKLKLLTPTGRIALQLRESRDGKTIFPEIALEDGDRIVVPNKPVTVSVVGLVFNTGDFLYSKNLKINDYIRFAGGMARNADKSKIYVIGVNGDARLVSGGWMKGESAGSVRPGDTIMVPEHPNPGQFMRDLKDWSSILGQFGIAAAAIKVLMQ